MKMRVLPDSSLCERVEITGQSDAADDFGDRAGLQGREQHPAVPRAHRCRCSSGWALTKLFSPSIPRPTALSMSIRDEIARNPNIGLMVFSRRFGQPAATMAGILNCTRPMVRRDRCRSAGSAGIDRDHVAQGAGRLRRGDRAQEVPARAKH